MYYQIERTYLASADRSLERTIDTKPYLVPGASARAAAIAFITHESAQQVGAIGEFPGDKATATALRDGRIFTIFVQRATDAILSKRRRPESEADEEARR